LNAALLEPTLADLPVMFSPQPLKNNEIQQLAQRTPKFKEMTPREGWKLISETFLVLPDHLSVSESVQITVGLVPMAERERQRQPP
jgi:hypothetical protein